jgi:hypothetical protein
MLRALLFRTRSSIRCSSITRNRSAPPLFLKPPVTRHQPKAQSIDEIYTIKDHDDPFLIAIQEKFEIESFQKSHFKQMIRDVKNKKRDEPHDIPEHIYEKSFAAFHDQFFTQLMGNRDSASRIMRAFRKAYDKGEEDELMWKLYLRDVTERYAGLILNYTDKEAPAEHIIDLTKPADWYPNARNMKRKIIFHTGPTNSGKTHSAFKALREAQRGIYAAPLRLLATEGFVKLTGMGLKCNLMTGDHKVEIDDATHTASTIGNFQIFQISNKFVEMVNTSIEYDVAVIDEIQLISDPDRGWAWTRAFLGVQAKEVHLCGEERTVKLLHNLCEATGEELQVLIFPHFNTC